MRTEVLALKAMGRMPNESLNDDEQTDKLVEQYDELLSAIERPLTLQEGEVLISLFPDNAFYDLHWDLLQLIEGLYGKVDNAQYIHLINTCPSTAWKEALQSRYQNAQNKS